MWPEGHVWKPGPAYPASGKSTSLSSTDPTPSVSGAEGAKPTTFPIPCPEGGIAYQPRVPTLGIPPAKQPRVLKERRIDARRAPWT
jgi:hypothetical protein